MKGLILLFSGAVLGEVSLPIDAAPGGVVSVGWLLLSLAAIAMAVNQVLQLLDRTTGRRGKHECVQEPTLASLHARIHNTEKRVEVLSTLLTEEIRGMRSEVRDDLDHLTKRLDSVYSELSRRMKTPPSE